jgi:hypothetical protein
VRGRLPGLHRARAEDVEGLMISAQRPQFQQL